MISVNLKETGMREVSPHAGLSYDTLFIPCLYGWDNEVCTVSIYHAADPLMFKRKSAPAF